MALKIIAGCVNCWACEPVCPNAAVIAATPHFLIDARECSECLGDYDEPQCAAICPIEGVIVDELQAGYTIKDRLLRPALVSVAKAKG